MWPFTTKALPEPGQAWYLSGTGVSAIEAPKVIIKEVSGDYVEFRHVGERELERKLPLLKFLNIYKLYFEHLNKKGNENVLRN
jgi:hypothetical protein